MHVASLWIAPVKGMRLLEVEALEVDRTGARGDRAFVVRDRDGAAACTTRTPALTQVVPDVPADADALALSWPDGRRVAGPVERGTAVTTGMYDGRPVRGRVVEGPFGSALSEHLGRPVDLVALDADEQGGDDSPLTLMGEASLADLAGHLRAPVDPRRFRMTITVAGTAPWEEHGWSGRTLRLGEELRVRVVEPTERCVVVTRDPDDGRRDLPVLKALAQVRGARDVTFGVWLEVLAAGRVRAGDSLTLEG